MNRERESNEAIVREGDIINGKVEGIGEKGDGIIRHNGLVIIVPDTKLEEDVIIKVTAVARKCAFGEKIQDSVK
ncbi:MAG: TRAM domain-containing protein [Nanoarchaeota archaeon]|nr:TRAM domain-containing protein [Nanoarchaeota archaeon]